MPDLIRSVLSFFSRVEPAQIATVAFGMGPV
jgi:hypothetical protein